MKSPISSNVLQVMHDFIANMSHLSLNRSDKYIELTEQPKCIQKNNKLLKYYLWLTLSACSMLMFTFEYRNSLHEYYLWHVYNLINITTFMRT